MPWLSRKCHRNVTYIIIKYNYQSASLKIKWALKPILQVTTEHLKGISIFISETAIRIKKSETNKASKTFVNEVLILLNQLLNINGTYQRSANNKENYLQGH